MLPTLKDVELELSRRECQNFSNFVKQAWHVIEPGVDFKENWHINAICDHLEAVSRGEIKRLIINIPPRHMKSLLVSVLWPAWVWTFKPTTKWMFSTYAQGLTVRDSVKCRRLIDSHWYKERWGNLYQLSSDQNQKMRFENDKTGYRLAISTGSATTGEGGDIIVVDDPLNASDASSLLKLEGAVEYWDNTLSTRLNDKKTGAFVVIMQRLHVNDLVGHIYESQISKGVHWDVLCFPQEYELNHPTPCVSSLGFTDPRTEEGELLWPAREGLEEINKLKLQLGSYGIAGQLQQRPAPAEGSLIKVAWLQYYNELPVVKRYVWSWDTAIKEGQHNDFSCGQLWAECANGYYLVENIKRKMEYPELKRLVQTHYEANPSTAVLIEDKASGQQLLQDFKRSTSMPVLPMTPGKSMGHSKVERVNLVSPLFEAGKVFVPEGRSWVADYVGELTMFPASKHDDQVDATTQALSYLKARIEQKAGAAIVMDGGFGII
ncbi:MAG: terminase [Caulobacteraceae bacterium]|nr:terminase [Caulobacteraceae bacterium]